MRILTILLASLLSAACAAQTPVQSAQPAGPPVLAEPLVRYADRQHPVFGTEGMVAAQNRLSAAVGAEVLAAGGNAVDAAVAVGFSLAVTLPRAGNLGGGGFMLVHDAASDTTIAIDYREMAPPAATRDMFLDADGNPDSSVSRFSHKAAGVPGTVAGLYLAHERYGRLPWAQILAPAIRQARGGIVVSFDMAQSLASRQERLCATPAACRYFFNNGEPYRAGEVLRQADLARTLEAIAEEGPDAFYRGSIADLIAAEMQRGGGLVDKAALSQYRPVVREPLRGEYHGAEIVTMPPPSSGGVHILQMLNVLSHFPLAEYGAGSAKATHVLAETMRLAYADRSKHLGDPDFYAVPVGWLTGSDYAAKLAAGIDLDRARPSESVAPGVAPPFESEDTTHYSVMDDDGNVVSNTYTLNLSYGSGIAVAGAGFLLNNEMDDFVSKPGVPNAFGLLGGKANAIEPAKRPLSSMTPTIVFRDGEPWLATGSPGGSRIITSVLQMLVNVIDHDMNIAEAVHAPRLHHQWYPDVLEIERGFSPDTVRLLEQLGHTIRPGRFAMGSVQTVAWRDGVFRGSSDPRRPNAASVTPPLDRDSD